MRGCATAPFLPPAAIRKLLMEPWCLSPIGDSRLFMASTCHANPMPLIDWISVRHGGRELSAFNHLRSARHFRSWFLRLMKTATTALACIYPRLRPHSQLIPDGIFVIHPSALP